MRTTVVNCRLHGWLKYGPLKGSLWQLPPVFWRSVGLLIYGGCFLLAYFVPSDLCWTPATVVSPWKRETSIFRAFLWPFQNNLVTSSRVEEHDFYYFKQLFPIPGVIELAAANPSVLSMHPPQSRIEIRTDRSANASHSSMIHITSGFEFLYYGFFLTFLCCFWVWLPPYRKADLKTFLSRWWSRSDTLWHLQIYCLCHWLFLLGTVPWQLVYTAHAPFLTFNSGHTHTTFNDFGCALPTCFCRTRGRRPWHSFVKTWIMDGEKRD